MWQSQNQKARGPGAKRTGRGHTRYSLQLKRVTAEIRAADDRLPDGNPADAGSARILLNDLSPRGVGIYCNKPFAPGQEVAIVLAVYSQIYLRGTVMYCQEQESKTQVIS